MGDVNIIDERGRQITSINHGGTVESVQIEDSKPDEPEVVRITFKHPHQ